MMFRAKQDFDCVELKSRYCQGLLYTVRPQDLVLGKLVSGWLNEGKIELVSGGSQMSGTAEVSG